MLLPSFIFLHSLTSSSLCCVCITLCLCLSLCLSLSFFLHVCLSIFVSLFTYSLPLHLSFQLQLSQLLIIALNIYCLFSYYVYLDLFTISSFNSLLYECSTFPLPFSAISNSTVTSWVARIYYKPERKIIIPDYCCCEFRLVM